MSSQIANIDILPTCQDVILKEGTTATLDIVLSNTPIEDPDIFIAADLTSSTVILTAKDNDDVVVLAKTNTPGNHSSPLEGRTIFTINVADTIGLIPAGKSSENFKYEVRRTEVGGQEYVHLEGKIIISEAVGQ